MDSSVVTLGASCSGVVGCTLGVGVMGCEVSLILVRIG